jgi:hypothetical protein
MGMNFGTPEGKQFLLHKWHPVPYLKLYIWKWLSNTEMYLTLHADLGSSNIQMCWSLIAAPDTDDHLFVHSLLYISHIHMLQSSRKCVTA